MHRASEKQELVILQVMECTTPINNVHVFLRCVYVRWNTGDELDRIVEPFTGSVGRKRMEFRECFEVGLPDRIQVTLNAVHANNCIEPFTSGRHWPQRRFYINLYSRGSGEEETYDGEINK